MKSKSADRISVRQIYVGDNGQKQHKTLSSEFVFIPFGRGDLPPYRLTMPINWAIDPFTDVNWCAQLHMWRMFDIHLIRHDTTRDSKWLDFPIAVMLDWSRFHNIENSGLLPRILAWFNSTGNYRSRYAWKDMMVGIRAMKLAYVISQAQHGLIEIDNDTNKVFEELAQRHLEFMLDPANISYSNHTFFDLQGAAALAQVAACKQRDAIYEHIAVELPKLLASQFTGHGVHKEHSPAYHYFCSACLRRLLNTGWFADFGLEAILAKAVAVRKWFLLPDGRKIPFGDTDGKEQDVSVRAPVFRGACQVFNSAGYAIIRGDGGGETQASSLLAVMGAFHGWSHKQADDLSFIWFEGEDILSDSGKYAYAPCPERSYAVSTRAHNTVEIDMQDYGDIKWYKSLGQDQIYGSAIREVSGYDWGHLISSGVNHARFGVYHRRDILYSMGRWVLALDRLKGSSRHDFTQWFHLAPHLPCPEKSPAGYHTLLRSGKSLRIFTLGGDVITEIMEKGVEKPRLQGWISQAYNRLTPNCALGFKQSGSDVFFATLFSLNDSGSTVELEGKQRLSLNISSAGKKERLVITMKEKTYDLDICFDTGRLISQSR